MHRLSCIYCSAFCSFMAYKEIRVYGDGFEWLENVTLQWLYFNVLKQRRKCLKEAHYKKMSKQGSEYQLERLWKSLQVCVQKRQKITVVD